jgi:pilus assembly protein CpaF
VVGLLRSLVEQRANLVVHGPTGSGKTTLINSLASLVGDRERIVVIEDVAELRISGEQVVRLETRDAVPGSPDTAVDQRTLVGAALRLRPDRLVVGEVRGPEALDMIWAMSSGHTGCMSTCHAHTAEGAITRLETMAVLATGDALGRDAVRSQILGAVDCFVGVGRAPGGQRRVNSIVRCSSDGLGSVVRIDP